MPEHGRKNGTQTCRASLGSRLVVREIRGRWSKETRDFLRHMAMAKGRGEPFPLHRKVEDAWLLRWRVIMVCSVAQAFVVSLLESLTCVRSDGGIPLTGEVIGDSRCEPVGE